MPRRRPKKSTGPLKEVNQQVNPLQSNRRSRLESLNQEHKAAEQLCYDSGIEPIVGIKSLLEDENCQPSSSSSLKNELSTDAAALYNELDTFRQRWKRELEVNKPAENSANTESSSFNPSITEKIESLNLKDDVKSIADQSLSDTTKSSHSVKADQPEQLYANAKKLFLMAVELEQDEMHHESIRYYKQAMRLCPDIEKQIFREQCEVSARSSVVSADRSEVFLELSNQKKALPDDEQKVCLYDRIVENFNQDNQQKGFTYCRPLSKLKSNTLHLSDLPLELIMQIFRYAIGGDLDLASLETIGLVCRGFYILSKEPSLWRSICYSTWGNETLTVVSQDIKCQPIENIDWRLMYLDRPRVNYDGVYISRTRYLRQGDVGFQDITYRPFHVIRYYRYLRFFPDRRVLILTTNEEPDKIIPIFRHALQAKQFSSELSILEGVYEFSCSNQINIIAEKDCRAAIPISNQSQRRQAQFHWSRQTPITQKFNFKFELKTAENRPYKNNVLKWLDYTLLTRLEASQEITSFDLTPDTFPNLLFYRVRRLNLRLTNPLQSA